MAKIRDSVPKRKAQKAAAQMKYQVTDKAVLAAFHRWATKRAKPAEVSDSEILALRQVPCNGCGRTVEGAGVGFLLREPRGKIALSNMISSCGICKLLKPKAGFDPIAFAKTLLRRAWKRTPMASIAKQQARRARGKYECAECHEVFGEKDTQTDHRNPVVDPKVGFVNLDTFARRLFCDDSNLQILCKPCHSKKTSAENSERFKKKDRK